MFSAWDAVLAAVLGGVTVVVAIVITGMGIWCAYMVDRSQGNKPRQANPWKVLLIILLTLALVIAWTMLSLYVLKRI